MEWIDLNLNLRYLNAEDVNNVYNNCLYIAEALEDLQASIDSSDVVDPGATMQSEIGEIQEILQTVEDDINVINEGDFEGINIVSQYYDEAKTIGMYFRLSDYQRWVMILNDLKSILENGIWQILSLQYEVPVFTNNKILVLRGERLA